MPDWYPLVRIARALNCRPWELLDVSTDWLAVGAALIEGEGMLAEYQSKPTKAPPSPTAPQARTLGRA